MPGINKNLLAFALAKTAGEKVAFVPSEGAAGQGGGAPPGGGGAPPGGDPAAGGGGAPQAPPMGADPASQPGGDPMGGMLDAKVQTAVQQAMQAAGGAGGAGGAGAGMKPPKPDINTVATDVFQLKKMIFHMFRSQGMELPPDVLDGPNRDPQSGLPSGTPQTGSNPTPGGPAAPQNAISGIQPIQPAMMGGGGGKMAADHSFFKIASTEVELLKEAASLLQLYACYKEALQANPIDTWGAKEAQESSKNVYGSETGVGQPFGSAKNSQSPMNKAAAVVSMFRARRN